MLQSIECVFVWVCLWEGLEVDEVRRSIEVGAVVNRVVVELERLYHVPLYVGEIGGMGVVGCWTYRALAVELTKKLSDGW